MVKGQNPNAQHSNTITIPSLLVNGGSTHKIAKAYRIAIGDISGNIQYHQSGLLDKKAPCLYAGLVYGKPWTRDAAINVWNGFGLLSPEVSKNTLLAQTEKNPAGETIIGGQYWDKIIWSIGAWNYFLYSGDQEFLEFAYKTTKNTLNLLEKEEFSPESGLFRGPAVYGDGVAAYPEIYTRHMSKHKSSSYSGIDQWASSNMDIKHATGHGIPMQTLSTNAVYTKVYNLLPQMEKALDVEVDEQWIKKAAALKHSINENLWNDEKGNYNYLIDPFGGSKAQESMGIAFSLLFDITNKEKANKIFETTVVEPAGIPCVYPSFPRYVIDSLDSYGRHSGTVWPHIQGFWADAAIKYDRSDLFLHEFNALTEHVNRDFQFVEIYHPTRKTPYGGLQEPHLETRIEWFCAERQTWSATAYLRMMFKNIIGMHFSEKGITFKPFLPPEIEDIALLGLRYQDMTLDILITGSGSMVKQIKINGQTSTTPILSNDLNGHTTIEIQLK